MTVFEDDGDIYNNASIPDHDYYVKYGSLAGMGTGEVEPPALDGLSGGRKLEGI